MRVLLDTNVVIDVLMDRQPWCADGREVFRAAADKKFYGCLVSKSIIDIHYLLKRNLHDESKVRYIIASLFELFEILGTEAIDCEKALLSDINDYEDAVLAESAARGLIDCIVTRNKSDFTAAAVEILDPAELLQRLA